MLQKSSNFDPNNTREFCEMGFQIVKCPICQKETLNNYWICRNCGWEYDGAAEENDYSSCNNSTVSEYRRFHHNKSRPE